MLEGKNYRSLAKVFPFVAAFIDRSTKYEKRAPITRVHTQYSDIVADVTGDVGQRACGKNDLDKLVRNLQEFKKMFVETFEEHCDLGLYALKYHLPDHMLGDIRRFGTLSVLDSNPWEHFNMLLKQAYKRSLQRRRTRMRETVGVMDRRYNRALSDGKKEKDDDGKLGWSDERLARLETNEPYVVRDGITITTDEMAQAADVGVRRRSTAGFASRLVDIVKLSTRIKLLALGREISSEWGRSVPCTEVQLMSVKSGYLIERYIQTVQDFDSEKGFIREPVEYKRRVPRVFVTDRLGSSGDNKSSFVLVPSGEEEGGGPWAAKVLLLFRVRLRGSHESEEYALLQHMEVPRPIDTVDKTLGCVCVRCSTDDQMEHSLRRGIGISEQGGLRVGEWFRMEPLDTL